MTAFHITASYLANNVVVADLLREVSFPLPFSVQKEAPLVRSALVFLLVRKYAGVANSQLRDVMSYYIPVVGRLYNYAGVCI